MAIEVTALNKNELLTRGWTVCSMGLSESQISKYLASTISLERKAADAGYLLKRKYYPHLFHENVAAIESPFNGIICNEGVEGFFSQLGLGSAIRELMGWRECHLHLARLFTMGSYKYRGNWHRDFNDWDGDLGSLKTIQVALFLKNQDGFRIFKYTYDSLLRDNNPSFEDPDMSPVVPLTCCSEYFDEIKGVAGTVLFFSPGIIHQGNSCTKRYDYHLRFSCDPMVADGETLEESQMFDFVAPDFYLKNYDVRLDRFCPRNRDAAFLEKFLNSINYYTGLVGLAKLILKKDIGAPKAPWRYSFSSNTIFQKKIK